MTSSIVVVGLNFRTAAIEIRERLALTGCALDTALEHLAGSRAKCRDRRGVCPDAPEAVILSTCNRLEFYLAAVDESTAVETVIDYLGNAHAIAAERIREHLYVMSGGTAVEHLLRVTSGLESMILGEPQILGQVGRAFEYAHASGKSGPVLSHLFSTALRAGKRAHCETGISETTLSLSHAAADLLAEQVPSLASSRVLVVGAGEMAVLAAQAVRDHGGRQLAYVNRTLDAAQELAGRFGGTAHPWGDLRLLLGWADAVISATGAPHTVITRDDIVAAQATRDARPLLLVDLALPRDIDASVSELAGVRCYDLDRLNATLEENRVRRVACVPAVEAIVAEEADSFMRWLRARAAAPTVAQLHEKARCVAEREVARTLRRLQSDDERLAHEIEMMTHRIVMKLLHEPTVRLKAQAEGGDGVFYREAVEELFALDMGEF
jgi:glutamyl-tRNA reductase